MLLKCGRSAVRSMVSVCSHSVSVCSHSGANNIRSSVLVELDLEEEYQRVNGVGLQSQREAISAVVDERAGGANNIRSM